MFMHSAIITSFIHFQEKIPQIIANMDQESPLEYYTSLTLEVPSIKNTGMFLDDPRCPFNKKYWYVPQFSLGLMIHWFIPKGCYVRIILCVCNK